MAFSDEDIKKFIGTYDCIDTQSPSSFMVLGPDGRKTSEYIAAICHSDMKHLDGFPSELITAVPVTDDPSTNYIRALIDGPFQQWKEFIELVRLDIGYYLHIRSLDKIPSKVVYNLCIASRAPIEYHYIVLRWAGLVEQGIHPSVALCLSPRDLKGDRMPFLGVPFSGHWWFQSDHDWHTIISGKPVGLETCPSYGEDPSSCTPTNIIWGCETRHILNGYCTMTVQELDEKFRKELNL